MDLSLPLFRDEERRMGAPVGEIRRPSATSIMMAGLDLEGQDSLHAADEAAAAEQADKEELIWKYVWLGIATASMVLNVIAAVTHNSIFIWISAFLAIILGAGVLLARKLLEDGDAMQNEQDALRKMVNGLVTTNTQLVGNISSLDAEATRLKKTETHLEEIATQQGTNVDSLRSLIEENQKVLDEKKDLVKSDTILGILEAVLKSDIDRSSKFTEREINLVVMRLKNLPAIEVNEPLLRRKLHSDQSLHSVIDVLCDVDDDGIPDQDHIIRIV